MRGHVAWASHPEVIRGHCCDAMVAICCDAWAANNHFNLQWQLCKRNCYCWPQQLGEFAEVSLSMSTLECLMNPPLRAMNKLVRSSPPFTSSPTPGTYGNPRADQLRLSDFKLNKELQRASSAFLSGFRRLIDEKWLRMLSEDELQQAWGWLDMALEQGIRGAM